MDEEKIQKMLDAKFKSITEDLAAAREEGASKEALTALTKEVETVGLALSDFIEAQKTKEIQTVVKQLETFLIANKDELKKIQSTKSGTIEFIPKVVAPITTGNGTEPDGGQDPNANARLGSFNFANNNSLLSLMTITETDSAFGAGYTEMIPKDGDYAFVAEGEEKPQIDFKWETRYPEPKKIAAYEILTEESVTDIKRLMSVAKEYLRKKHDLFKVNAAFFAAGTGVLPKGATLYGRQFVAGAMALKLTAPNFMDIVNAVVTDVYTTHNYVDELEYMPNLVLISPIDFFLEFQSAKDANGLPLWPQASLFNSLTVGGITIKPWYKIPPGKIFVADLSKYNIINYIPFSIRIGWINDQFITNMFTMLGESRFFQFVKNMDEQAFVYDDIATIKTAITKV